MTGACLLSFHFVKTLCELLTLLPVSSFLPNESYVTDGSCTVGFRVWVFCIIVALTNTSGSASDGEADIYMQSLNPSQCEGLGFAPPMNQTRRPRFM